MAKYYISTGLQNNYYTLRYVFTEFAQNRLTGEVYTYKRDYHVRNLSIDREQAIAKAKEITGKDLTTSITVRPMGEKKEVDWSILHFGKYQGLAVAEVVESDPDYLIWVAENFNSQQHEKTLDLIKSLLAHRLEERANDRKAEEEARAARAEKLAEIMTPILTVLDNSYGGFCESIARDIRNGHMPSGRAYDIVIDIYGKAHGRRNSKKYDAACDTAAEIMEAGSKL